MNLPITIPYSPLASSHYIDNGTTSLTRPHQTIMVSPATIKKAIADLKSTGPAGLTALVAGGTSGIGKGFLYKLAEHTTSPKIYIVGRSESTLNTIISDLKTVNPEGTYIPILSGDLTLVNQVSKATAQIISQESSKIDILFLSQGFLTLRGRDETPEGLDKITAIRYYGRLRFILDLLPLLEKSPNSPRVISVLNGGGEGKVIPEDLGLKDPKNTGAITSINAVTTYVTLTLERLARDHPRVSFIHAHPGVVRTNIFNAEHFHPAFAFVMNKVIGPTLLRLVTISPEESGERFLYEATSGRFPSAEGAKGREKDGDVAVGTDGRKGSGAYIVTGKCEAVLNQGVLKPLRDNGVHEKIWDYTVGELERVKGWDV